MDLEGGGEDAGGVPRICSKYHYCVKFMHNSTNFSGVGGTYDIPSKKKLRGRSNPSFKDIRNCVIEYTCI